MQTGFDRGVRDMRLPTTQEELRDWIVAAWEDGWRSRAHAVGRPMGTVMALKTKGRDAFLKSWDLPPVPIPPVDPRPAGRILAESFPEPDPRDDRTDLTLNEARALARLRVEADGVPISIFQQARPEGLRYTTRRAGTELPGWTALEVVLIEVKTTHCPKCLSTRFYRWREFWRCMECRAQWARTPGDDQ